MAGGPIFPKSAVAVDAGYVFDGSYINLTHSIYAEGLGVVDATTLDQDASWMLIFRLPEVLPSGQCTLSSMIWANATSGVVRVNPEIGIIDADENWPTLVAEGNADTTWAAGDDQQAKELTVDMDAVTIAAGKLLIVEYKIINTGTTISVASFHQPSLIWV